MSLAAAEGEALRFRRMRRTPLAVQVVGLLIAGLVIAQAAAISVVILLPPDRTTYRTEDVAAALQGGPLALPHGHPFVRSTGARPVERNGPGWVAMGRQRRDLADALHRPEDDVYLRIFLPPPFAGVGELRGGGGGPRGGFPGRPPGSAAGPDPRFGPPGDWPPRRPEGDDPYRFHRGPPIIRTSFVAALKQADGRWVTVQPAPDAFLNSWQRRVLLWFLASIAILAPLGYLFARRLAAPLNAFAEAADRLGRDPRTPLMPLDGPAEIGLAARAFNRMQAQLQRYVEDRTAMVGAISHDLRTPLSRIRFKLEGAPDDLKRSVLNDVRQMEEMITSVLTFIRDGAEPGPRERLDLRSVVECEVDEAALVGGDVLLEPGDDMAVEADAGAVQRLVANLIDNALKYGDSAVVRLRRDGEEAVVEVTDAGPGLPPAELERVFLPFYRAEAARNLDTGGIGLGLAVARSIARAHGGDVTLSAGEKGLTAMIRLPLAPAAKRHAAPVRSPSHRVDAEA